MNRLSSFLSLILIAGCAFSCTPDDPKGDNGEPGTEQPGSGETDKPTPPVEEKSRVYTWVTTENENSKFKKIISDFGKPGSMSPYVVKIDESTTYQTVDGFGGAVTGATCYNLLKMSQDKRTEFLTNIFSRESGLGSSLIRVSIGASDFSVHEDFTWCDKEGLENFAPHKEDVDYLFPILKEIYAINPDVKIIASPWSCPRWMKANMPGGNSWDNNKFNDPVTDEKTFNSWTGGRLKPSCYDDYAEYFVKWIQHMEGMGFDIYAVTLQNEPLNPGNSMSMVMPWQDQKDFIKVVGPALEKAGLGDVKILLFDHNYNYDGKPGQDNYPLNIYADPESSKWAAGSAWHSYGGHYSELDEIIAVNPDKEIFFTEASIGEWNHQTFDANFLGDFEYQFFGPLQRMSSGSTVWNLMLDDKRGPHRGSGACATCFGVVDINSSDYSTLKYNTHYYHIAHTSMVIKPGAVRIGTSSNFNNASVPYLVFKNTDGSYGIVIMNISYEDQTYVFSMGDYTVKVEAKARALTSVLWKK